MRSTLDTNVAVPTIMVAPAILANTVIERQARPSSTDAPVAGALSAVATWTRLLFAGATVSPASSQDLATPLDRGNRADAGA